MTDPVTKAREALAEALWLIRVRVRLTAALAGPPRPVWLWDRIP